MSNRSRDCTGSKMDSDLNRLQPELTDEQWSLISDLFPDKPVGPKGGRRRIGSRACFEGILWVLRSGARWKDLPPRFPSYATCWRRFAEWSCDEIWDVALRRLLDALEQKGKINWKEGFADGTFASAKKGAISLVRPTVAKVPSSWFSPTATVCRWPLMSKQPTMPK